MLRTPLGRFAAISILEAISFLVLLLIAMPLKRIWGFDQIQYYVGLSHGVLWMLYLASVAEVTLRKQWPSATLLPGWWQRRPKPWITAALVASVVPTGPFFLESRLRRRPEAATA